MKKKTSFADKVKSFFGGLREAPPEDLIASEMADLAERREEAQREAGIFRTVERPEDIEELDDPENAGADIHNRGISFRRRSVVVDDEHDMSSFSFQVEDVFSIAGRGTVVTGSVTEGMIRVGDTARLLRRDGSQMKVTISGIEMFREKKERAFMGDHVGILLRNVPRGNVFRGDRLVGNGTND